jgi:ABC-type nitrate/sulfonate/bicarbonate transport system permease component
MLLLKVVFPAALPQTFAGLRLAIGTAWMIIVAAEIIASKAGLGYILLAGRNFAQASIIFIGIALIGLLAFITDRIGRAAYMYVTRWMKRELEV